MRQQAQEHAALLPALLAEAQHLAASVVLGSHGRRRAGQGEEFWQFRSAVPGDPWRSIDWRRSARSDAHFIRQHEWQAAQSVLFWLDHGRSMAFTGDPARPTKQARANLIGLAAAILLVRGGERVGLMDDPEPPRPGQTQIDRLVAQIGAFDDGRDHGMPADHAFPRGARAVFVSDFLGPWQPLRDRVLASVDRGVAGALVQVLDPVEEAFPFDGRTEFLSISGAIRFETLRARGLRTAYLERLVERKATLQALAADTGWRYHCHHTDAPAQPALMWLYTALEKDR
ncbi:MAG: DUF58 domain-containing protein [Rhodobacteraceae bacterium]|nr:DUF58 domain-containing protein [Paracoccaceae bacterium]